LPSRSCRGENGPRDAGIRPLSAGEATEGLSVRSSGADTAVLVYGRPFRSNAGPDPYEHVAARSCAGFFRVQRARFFGQDSGPGTGGYGNASPRTPESRIRRSPVDHGKSGHASSRCRTETFGGMPLREGETAVPLHGGEVRASLGIETGHIKGRSRERKADDRTKWTVRREISDNGPRGREEMPA